MASIRIGRASRGSALIAYVLGAFVFLCGLHPLQAQGGTISDADAKAIQSYRLTDAGLSKFMQASRNLVQVAKQHPEIAEQEKNTDPKSLADMEAMYDRHPEVKHAIASTGMSSRDYVLFSMAVFQAGMAAAVAEQPGGKIPDGVAPENVDFYKKHADEMKKFGEELEKSSGAVKDTSGSAENRS